MDADILCGPLLTYPELVAEDHVAASGTPWWTVDHPAVGTIQRAALPRPILRDTLRSLRPTAASYRGNTPNRC